MNTTRSTSKPQLGLLELVYGCADVPSKLPSFRWLSHPKHAGFLKRAARDAGTVEHTWWWRSVNLNALQNNIGQALRPTGVLVLACFATLILHFAMTLAMTMMTLSVNSLYTVPLRSLAAWNQVVLHLYWEGDVLRSVQVCHEKPWCSGGSTVDYLRENE